MAASFHLLARRIALAAIVSLAASIACGDEQTVPRTAEQDNRFELFLQLARRRGGEPAALAQTVQMAHDLPAAQGAMLYDALAEAHLRAGNLDLASECRRAIIDEFPQEPAARNALAWLVRLYSSSEVAHARRMAGQPSPEPAGVRMIRDAELHPAAAEANSEDEPYLAFALHLSAVAAESQASWRNDPAIKYQRATTMRRLGRDKAGSVLLASLKNDRSAGQWLPCARAEDWLDDGREGACPVAVHHCVKAAKAPLLDGVLDDECWAPAAMSLNGKRDTDTGNAPAAARVHLIYDSEYLYLAADCPKLPGVSYPRDERTRPRDADLAQGDRIRILLDVDRDYSTCFELSVDSRGYCADACWGDAQWNPRWFVAAAQSSREAGPAWTIEAAIPLSELAGKRPASGDAWACAVERLAPDVEPQSWTGVAANPPGPQAFGLLLFD